MIDTIWQRAFKFIPYILPFLLIFSRSAADITVLIVGILFLVHSNKYNKWRWTKHLWFKCSLVFWLYLLFINAPLSSNFTESFLYSLAFIRWPIFAAAIAFWILKDSDMQKRFLLSMLIVLFFICFDTWWQYFFRQDIFGYVPLNEVRLTGPFRNNNAVPGIFIARLMGLLLYVAVIFPPLRSDKKIILICFIVSLLMLVSVYITGERMALILACIVSFITITALYIEYFNKEKKLVLLLTTILGLTIICILLFIPQMFERQINESIIKFSDITNSDYGLVFESAYKVWAQSPLFGVGMHQYSSECILLGLKTTGSGVCMHPHNIVFHLLSEMGVIGFVLYYIMIFSIVLTALKTHYIRKNYLFLFFGFSLLFVSFFPLIVGMSLFNNWIGATIWLLVGWALAQGERR